MRRSSDSRSSPTRRARCSWVFATPSDALGRVGRVRRVGRVGIKSCPHLPNPPHPPHSPNPPDRFLLAGVMGWPVMHSRSPALHNYFFKQYRLAGTYVPLAIKPEGLEPALRALAPLGFAGCNLTIPHKERALAIVDEVDALARAIGAISCVVVRPDGSLWGTNNDVHGFGRNTLQQQPGWRAGAGPAVVIGAGGGARAVVYSLVDRGAPEIRVANRTRARAETLAREFGPAVMPVDWTDRH